MKKYLKPIIFAIALGCLFGYLFFKQDEPLIEEVISETKLINFIQVGVFNNYSNAINKQKEFNSSIIIKDEDKYRVFIGIFNNTEVLNKMKKIYEANKYDYYIKKDNVNNEDFLYYLDSVEKLMLKTDDVTTLNKLAKQIIDKYKEVIR